MEKQAQFDALTELPNRFYMMAKLKNLFEAENAGANTCHFSYSIDIDAFLRTCNVLGHSRFHTVAQMTLYQLAKLLTVAFSLTCTYTGNVLQFIQCHRINGCHGFQ